MTTLLSTTLINSLSQEILVKSPQRVHVASVCPYILMFGNPSGTFTLEIIKDAVTIFSQSFNSVDIKTSVNTINNYVHTYFPIVPSSPLLLKAGSYTFKISAAGYAETATSFIGWIQQHEDIQNDMEYIPANDSENPLTIRFKLYV